MAGARIPTQEDLGGIPALQPARQVTSYDLSPLKQGAAAIEQGGEKVGAMVENAGTATAEIGLAKGRYETRIAEANRNAELATLNAEITSPTNTDYAGMVPTYQKRAQEIFDKWGQTISVPSLQVGFQEQNKELYATHAAQITRHATGMQNEAENAYRQGPLADKTVNAALATSDDAERARLLNGQLLTINEAETSGKMHPEAAKLERRQFIDGYAEARAHKQIKDDPQAFITEWDATRPEGSEITGRILQAEGATKNGKSSATGAGQFINSTWLDMVKRYKPELAAGKSDQDILALRADRNLGREMTENYRQENMSTLKKAGVDASPGNQYLAHFLGPKGAVALATAAQAGDTGTPVIDVLSKAVGPDMAGRMVAANRSVLEGQTVGSVQQWADRKMGGAYMDAAYKEVVSPVVRERLLAAANAELQRRTAAGSADFALRERDTVAQSRAGQEVKQPLGEADFIAKHGADLGPKLYQNYKTELQVGNDMQAVATMAPEDFGKLITKYDQIPENGQGAAELAKGKADVVAAYNQVTAERTKDPGGYAVARLPAVNDAWRDAQTAVQAGTPDAPALIAKYVATTTAEQQRVGVAPEAVRILPKAAIDELVATIEKPAPGKDPGQVNARIQQQAKMWGDAWPQITRELKGAAPLTQVLGAGVTPAAAQRLVDASKTTFKDIVKDEHSAKAMDVQNAVNDEMKDFGRSLLANQGAMTTYDNFRGQVEKLSALYVFQDAMTAPDAAKKATSDVIGHNYEFRDGFRIPAKDHQQRVPYSPDDIQLGAATAMARLGQEAGGINLAVKPAIDTFGGAYSPKELAAQSAAQVARDGKWTTTDDERGVALTFNGAPVARPDGKAFVLTWDQLAALAKVPGAEREEALHKQVDLDKGLTP